MINRRTLIMKIRICGVTLILYTAVLVYGCTDQKRSEYNIAFESRRDSLLTHYAGQEPAKSYTIITAKLLRGVDIEKSLMYLDSLYQAPWGNMFWMYNSLSMYHYTKPALPEEYRMRYRDLWRTYTPDRTDTENHWIMYYTSLYLAAEEWPDEPGDRWYTGKSSAENLKEAREWIEFWMKTTTTIGQGEFDSPHYMTVYLAPMFMLYEFGKDRIMKTKAQMMIDYLLADFSAEYLRGNYCGAHSRDMIPTVTNPLSAAMTSFGWLFFGDTEFRPGGDALIAALSSYRLPEVIYRIATDRSEPYVHLERKRLRNVIRYGEELNPPVFKYTYMTQDYALGSLSGGIAQPIQQHTWDVTFVSGKPHNSIFSIHPYYSEYELGKFFPEPLKILVDGISRVRPKYPDPNKWVGSSPYTQTMQHRNAIIVLFNIAEGVSHPHINGFFPKTLDARITDESGWIFCKGGNVYVAYYPLKPYVWIEEDINWRLRSYEKKNGLVLEVVSQDQYSSFEAFQEHIRSNGLFTDGYDETLTVAYTTTDGDTIQFTYDGERKVNSNPVSFETGYLFKSKFMTSLVGSEALRLTAGGITRDLDFKEVEIRESK
jgi:hypothetical protein